ncbi:MAG: FG-GAP repeat protein, partial [Anaerolineales bacterium]|nr:FG-GAP repeat protein [Anaerolineales bacterium]
MQRRIFLLGVLLLGWALTTAAANPPPLRSAKNPARPLAFNGGRFSDLAIGAKDEAVGTIVGAGSVSVLYGTLNRLGVSNNQYWTQNLIGGADASEQYDHFGRALAIGDFDGDGYRDLAIGIPYETVGSVNFAGAVHILYGLNSSTGLSATGNQFWHQDSTGMNGAAEQDDHFGWALAAGDFNGDGYDDLAIGVPDENIGTISNAGGVHVMYGSSGGLTTTNNKIWHQDEETSGDP